MTEQIESLLEEWVNMHEQIEEKRVHHVPLTDENRQIIMRCKALHLELKRLGYWATHMPEHELARLERERIDKQRKMKNEIR